MDEIGLERAFENEDGSLVTWDCLFFGRSTSRVLLVEAKSALGREEAEERFRDQLDKHRNVTVESVIAHGGITLGDDGLHDVALVVFSLDPNTAALLDLFEDEDPHVVVHAELVDFGGGAGLETCTVIRGNFADEQLTNELQIDLDQPEPIPEHWLPFDADSNLLDVLVEILPILQGLFYKRVDGITEADIGALAIPVWDLLDREARTGLGTRIKRVLQGLSRVRAPLHVVWDNDVRRWRFPTPQEERLAQPSPPGMNKESFSALERLWGDAGQLEIPGFEEEDENE